MSPKEKETNSQFKELERNGGWLEELNSERRVIKVYGHQQVKLAVYSVDEHVNYSAIIQDQTYFASIVILDSKEEVKY
ncbi:hypothetical protein ASG65_00905 [Bacillus sp. Leaf13]|nr:hypothetical protein ASG65_00905 [Bacillus sp. Leaf13]KRF65504.1 hypothetical protein ASG99_18625 [Bacillus sp. Soil768D1]